MNLKVFLKEYTDQFPVGWYDEERKIGTTLKISVETTLQYNGGHELSDTFNYEHMVKIIKSLKNVEMKLLEEFAEKIIEKLKVYPQVIAIKVLIDKPSLPVTGFAAASCGIEMNWDL